MVGTMSATRRTVGVLGGMGPEATVDFMAKVIAETRADKDQDHIRMLVDHNPTVPDRQQGGKSFSHDGRCLPDRPAAGCRYPLPPQRGHRFGRPRIRFIRGRAVHPPRPREPERDAGRWHFD